MTTDKGWVYEDKGVVIYRASSLGSCLRSLVAARTGETQSPFHATIRAAMDVSSGLEEELLRRLNDGSIIWQQKEVDLRVDVILDEADGGRHLDPIIVRGHIDGLHQQSDTVIEAKCLSTDNYDRYITGGLDGLGHLAEKYKMQAAVYGHATGRKVRMVVGEKVNHSLQTMEHPHEPGAAWGVGRVDVGPPIDPSTLVTLEAIHSRIATIEDFATHDELPDCTANCRPGDPYAHCHVFEAPTQGDADLQFILGQYDECKKVIDQMTELKDELRERIINEYGVGKYTAGAFNCRVEHVKPTQRFDSKRFKKEHPDVYEDYVTWGQPTIRVTVTGGE